VIGGELQVTKVPNGASCGLGCLASFLVMLVVSVNEPKTIAGKMEPSYGPVVERAWWYVIGLLLVAFIIEVALLWSAKKKRASAPDD
jgi:hypothetical protein